MASNNGTDIERLIDAVDTELQEVPLSLETACAIIANSERYHHRAMHYMIPDGLRDCVMVHEVVHLIAYQILRVRFEEVIRQQLVDEEDQA